MLKPPRVAPEGGCFHLRPGGLKRRTRPPESQNHQGDPAMKSQGTKVKRSREKYPSVFPTPRSHLPPGPSIGQATQRSVGLGPGGVHKVSLSGGTDGAETGSRMG